MKGLRSKFEQHHGVKYSNNVLKAAISLSDKYITDRHLPDKAIDVIDEAGALVQLLPKSRKRLNISIKDIENVVSALAKVPQASVAHEEKKRLKDIKSQLKLLIFGQDHAIDRVVDTILMARSGLGNEEKPMGSFLFAGPTGVGKTELAKQLGIHLGMNFARFDMSEYMEKHSVAKFIGAPPGYVGHDQGGLLTDAIKKAPHSVLLLDEIEKAHIDIFNVLLQVMDHGKMTDSQGRTTDFRNIILIMTTNAGAKEMESGVIGLGNRENSLESKRDKVIKNFFSPEFRNRLDSIVHFSGLGEDLILKIVEKFLYQLEIRLLEKNIELKIDDEVKKWLAKEGFDPQLGARPLERLINEEIKRPCSHEILFGKLEKGGSITVTMSDNRPHFTFS